MPGLRPAWLSGDLSEARATVCEVWVADAGLASRALAMPVLRVRVRGHARRSWTG